MKDFRDQDYYELLDLDPQATSAELEQSYRRARRYFGAESAAIYALFEADELALLRRRIEEAYRVLGDPERRGKYDRELFGDERKEDPPPVDRFEPAEDLAAEPEWSRTQRLELSQGDNQDISAAEADSEPPAQIDSVEDRIIVGREEQPGGEPPAEEPAGEQPPSMPVIGEDSVYSGELLRQVREARGYTLERLAQTTKIAIYYLRSLESENYGELPALVYVRGYLKQIAKLLRLDPEAAARTYLERWEQSEKK